MLSLMEVMEGATHTNSSGSASASLTTTFHSGAPSAAAAAPCSSLYCCRASRNLGANVFKNGRSVLEWQPEELACMQFSRGLRHLDKSKLSTHRGRRMSRWPWQLGCRDAAFHLENDLRLSSRVHLWSRVHHSRRTSEVGVGLDAREHAAALTRPESAQ